VRSCSPERFAWRVFARRVSSSLLWPLSRNPGALVALLSWPLILGLQGVAPAHGQPAHAGSFVSAPVTPLRVTVDPKSLEVGVPGPVVTVPEGEPLPTLPPPPRKPVRDPVIQGSADVLSGEATESLSDPDVNIAGMSSSANPPDTVGDVGQSHVVQMVNATRFQVWDKAGNALTGAMAFGNLWPAIHTCRSSVGDPIVVYDHLANRWLLSQIADPNHMCVAISQTADPTAGTWFLYAFNVGTFPDYPKFGAWPDGYYMSSYEGSTLGVFVFDRASMLLGNPARFMKTAIPSLGAPGVRDTRILPSDLDGPAPPAGTANFFVRTVDDQQDPGEGDDRIEVYEFVVDWPNGTFSFTLSDTLLPAPFNIMLCNRNGGGTRDCVPQPSTTATVDALSNRPMMQLKYRDFGTHQALVFNQTIDVGGSMPVPTAKEVAGLRWYELRRSGAHWAIFQEGTYAPQPPGVTAENQLLHRFMGSAAMDKDGNIALGYSIGNDDNANPVYPGIRYAGRRFDDPPGVLAQGEKIIRDGVNSQTGGFGRRWGDYSAMSVDPVDDCTFWYTTHVAGVGGTGSRPTRIASFRFDTCAPVTGPAVTVTATDPIAVEQGPDPGVFTVSRTGPTESPLTVSYAVGGSAINGTDYQSLSGSVTILANAATATVVVTPIDDARPEGIETVTVTITPGSGYAVGSPNTATVAIIDNDANDLDLPDLIQTSVSDPPPAAARGSSFSVTDSVLNQGPEDAGPSTTRYYLSWQGRRRFGDRRLSGSRAVPGLAIGAESPGAVVVSIPASTFPGTYFLLACADDLRVVREIREWNNCRASSATVVVSP